VTVKAREGATDLQAEALEAIDGTPIIDLKIAMGDSREAEHAAGLTQLHLTQSWSINIPPCRLYW
jgi:tRNA (Thr-GGU) A37 N-methylase